MHAKATFRDGEKLYANNSCVGLIFHNDLLSPRRLAVSKLPQMKPRTKINISPVMRAFLFLHFSFYFFFAVLVAVTRAKWHDGNLCEALSYVKELESFWAEFSDWAGLDWREFRYVNRDNDDDELRWNILNRQTIFLKRHSDFDPSRKPAWNEIFMVDR